MLNLLTIVGARPQFIKAAALSRALSSGFSQYISEKLVHTGQHYDRNMSEHFFSEMGIPEPAYHLGISTGLHGEQTARMLASLEEILLKEKPDMVLVYGDTNSTLAGALAAAKLHIPLVHVEAGLRSFNKSMPEEINRIVTDHLSSYLFAPTTTAVSNLAREGIVHHAGENTADLPGVWHTGDIMFDNAVYFGQQAEKKSGIGQEYGLEPGRFLLATIHRPVNTDDPGRLAGIMEGLAEAARLNQRQLIFPVHPRTRPALEKIKGRGKDVILVPPVSFLEMTWLEKNAACIITDSGGVQKEAWFFGKPVVVLRKETEWVEIIQAGNGILADADKELILSAVNHFLAEPPVGFPPVYGNGKAGTEILGILTGMREKS
ncbi:MAG: non-hydrolyzing UDP-N-acetylglucosamine 2-epimerase [Bacteroidota bacterium]